MVMTLLGLQKPDSPLLHPHSICKLIYCTRSTHISIQSSGDQIFVTNWRHTKSNFSWLEQFFAPIQITLTIQRAIQPKIASPIIHQSTPPKNDSHLVKLISGEAPLASKPNLRNIPHVALYLTITSSEDDSEPDKDILYQYPKTEAATKLVGLRGMFLTLSDLMSSVTGSTANSSTLVLDKKLVHVVYSKLDRDVLVVAMPEEKVPLVQLQKVVNDVTQILSLTFGSMQRAFCDKLNKVRVDNLFSLLFDKALATPPGASEKDCVNKLTDLLPGVQWLNLPLAVEVHVHCCLNDLEAADYGEFADEFFQIRRLYTILGSSPPVQTTFHLGYHWFRPQEKLSQGDHFGNFFPYAI